MSGLVAEPNGAPSTVTVLVAVDTPHVREALVAMLGALDGFQVVAEASSDDQALEMARQVRPHLAVVDQELSGCNGCWAIQVIQHERLANVIVAIGRRASSTLAETAGARAYVQVGTPPRDFVSTLQAVIAT